VIPAKEIVLFLSWALLTVTGALVSVIVYVFSGLSRRVERQTQTIDKLKDDMHDQIGKLREEIFRLLEFLHTKSR
jgi:hypothetical protein